MHPSTSFSWNMTLVAIQHWFHLSLLLTVEVLHSVSSVSLLAYWYSWKHFRFNSYIFFLHRLIRTSLLSRMQTSNCRKKMQILRKCFNMSWTPAKSKKRPPILILKMLSITFYLRPRPKSVLLLVGLNHFKWYGMIHES